MPLSWHDAADVAELASYSAPAFQLFAEIHDVVAADASLDAACSLATKLEGGWSWADGVLLQNSKVFVPSSLPLVEILLAQAHGTGHEGVQKTLLRLRADFSIDKDRARVQEFVRSC